MAAPSQRDITTVATRTAASLEFRFIFSPEPES
jgi:hypothetical protein